LTQMGAIGSLMTGNFKAPAATIIFGPAVVSKMLLNPTTAAWLTQGVKLHPASEAAGGLMSRLIGAANKFSRKPTNEE